MGDPDSDERPARIHHIDGAAVGELRHGEASECGERNVVVERRARQQRPGIGKKRLPILASFALGDIAEDHVEGDVVAVPELRDRRFGRKLFPFLRRAEIARRRPIVRASSAPAPKPRTRAA